MKNAEKSDGGVYRLDLENQLGMDSCCLQFSVNGWFFLTLVTRKIINSG